VSAIQKILPGVGAELASARGPEHVGGPAASHGCGRRQAPPLQGGKCPDSAEPAGAEIPGAAELREIAAREGIDAATLALYRSVRASAAHGPFIRRVEEIAARPAPARLRRDVLLAIVPAAHYRENPRTGADGRLLREEAERLGYAVELVPVASAGRVRENARFLLDWLRERSGGSQRAIVLASLSKGGAEVKMALAEAAEAGTERAFAGVGAWLDLCGLVDGTPLAEWLLSRHRGAVLTRLYYRLRRQSLGFLEDLRHGPGTLLDFALKLPEPGPAHLRAIHVVGFPLREHLEHGISRRSHRCLAPLGPNDASLLLADVFKLPGLVYPVWGADHYLQPKSDVRRLIAAILQYVDETWEERR